MVDTNALIKSTNDIFHLFEVYSKASFLNFR
jgi:hypothetical protein